LMTGKSSTLLTLSGSENDIYSEVNENERSIMNSKIYYIISLFVIFNLLIIAIFLFGCAKSTDKGDPILYLISGYVVDNDSQLPLDSVKVTRFRVEYQPAYCITDSDGFYLFSPFGYFHSQIEIQLLFEKVGYISKDTMITISKQGEIIDSLTINLISE